MTTFASLFTGFGGADIGALQAGLTPIWGIEYDAQIAAVGNQNLGGHIQVANILDCNPGDFAPVDVLHASPPCPSFSQAKVNGEETALDIALAQKVAEFIKILHPPIFTLENVWGYRQSKSWAISNAALIEAGYWHTIDHCNAADFSVPQTRKRMIVRAIRSGFVPYLPAPEPWVGWYQAIENLIPNLPDTQFAPWQLQRLPEEARTLLVGNSGYDGNIVTATTSSPAMTITANSNQAQLRAFLMTQQSGNVPTCTITATTKGAIKAFLADTTNATRDATIRQASEPCMTITGSSGKRPSHLLSHVNGRVAAMTPRCLARFQSFPDWYQLPDSKSLAAKGIGNAVPPLMYEKIVKGLVTANA